MKRLKLFVLAACVSALAGHAPAADYSDPTWPCVQRKVESLSLGLMWPHPLDLESEVSTPELEADIDELAGYLALRRVEVESLAPQIEAFAATYDGDAQALGLAFSEVFDRLSKRRTRIIGGIEKFSLSQIALAEQIDTARAEMDKALAADAPDFDRVDALEEQIDWDQVIYTDRQRNIAYLCETPTLLERRLFNIAQTLGRAVREQG